MVLDWFPIAAVRSDHKLHDLKQHGFILLQFWTSEVRWVSLGYSQKCQQGCLLLLEALGESVSLPVPASRGHLNSLACGLPPFQSL